MDFFSLQTHSATYTEAGYSLCVKCGKCRSVCPVFGELNEEGASPRGKIALIQALFERGIEPSARTKRFVSECLLCSACVYACPNGVRTDMLIVSARQRLSDEMGLDLVEAGLTKVGFSRTGISFKLASIVEKVVGRRILSESGVFYRLPANRIIPQIKSEPFSGSGGNIYKHKTKTGFFPGCLIDFIYHDVAKDAAELLGTAGIKPYIPGHQACCGLPALSLGDMDKARKQAKVVMSLFEDADIVVTACGSCGSMLKNYYPFVFEGHTEYKKAVLFSEKVKDVTELLAEEPGVNSSEFIVESLSLNHQGLPLVTYHDPCHLKRGMSVSEKPRELIKKAGYTIAEMDEPDRCCGLGGAFNIKHRSISSAITRHKVYDIKSTKASIVATGCPGCMANIASMAIEQGLNLKVVHTVNLLAHAKKYP